MARGFFMGVQQIQAECSKRGIELSAVNGELKICIPPGAENIATLFVELKQHKAELIRAMETAEARPTTPPAPRPAVNHDLDPKWCLTCDRRDPTDPAALHCAEAAEDVYRLDACPIGRWTRAEYRRQGRERPTAGADPARTCLACYLSRTTDAGEMVCTGRGGCPPGRFDR